MGWTEQINQHWDKLVFVGGASYLLGVTVWLAQQPRWPWNRPPIARETTPAETLSASDSQFIAYLQQSLKQLNEKPNQSPRPSASPSAQATPQAQEPALSTLPLPASFAPQPPAPPSLPATSRPGVIERYYYPVYPNNPPAPLTPPPLTPTLPPKTPLAAIPRPLQPQTLAPSTPSIAPLVNQKTRYSLLGVLEAGERSSALFNGDNLTQRFQIGEAIGSSGWMLTGVNNQKAILSKGGKTRYLEVGQSF
jgi:hypothetical protein